MAKGDMGVNLGWWNSPVTCCIET